METTLINHKIVLSGQKRISFKCLQHSTISIYFIYDSIRIVFFLVIQLFVYQDNTTYVYGKYVFIIELSANFVCLSGFVSNKDNSKSKAMPNDRLP